MVRGRKAGIAAALAIVAAAAVTAGCGGGAGRAVALDPVAAAATKTQDAGAARLYFTIAAKTPQSHGTVKLNGAGAIDGTSSELSFKLASLPQQSGMQLPLGVTRQQILHARLKEIALEQHGDYLAYLNLGSLASQIPGGKQWIELDLSKLGKSAGVDLGKVMSGAQFRPGDLLSMLKAEGATVHKVGSATIDGTATTHYRVSVDLAKAMKQNGFTNPELATGAAKMKSASANVWIGKDGLLRRVQVAYGLAKTHVAMTMNLWDYGAHATIAAPPGGSVYDVTQLVQGLGSLN